eukprot:jgi/Picre1/31423/NNA_006775.t1
MANNLEKEFVLEGLKLRHRTDGRGLFACRPWSLSLGRKMHTVLHDWEGVFECAWGLVVHSLDDREGVPLTLHHFPVCLTFASFDEGDVIVVDPSSLEESTCDGRLTISRELSGIGKGFETHAVARVASRVRRTAGQDSPKRVGFSSGRGPAPMNVESLDPSVRDAMHAADEPIEDEDDDNDKMMLEEEDNHGHC